MIVSYNVHNYLVTYVTRAIEAEIDNSDGWQILFHSILQAIVKKNIFSGIYTDGKI